MYAMLLTKSDYNKPKQFQQSAKVVLEIPRLKTILARTY